ncbi:MAG: FlgD immunoglobulin-like domain containing protein, partial [Candidatus Zixiibacteriota bacterium]
GDTGVTIVLTPVGPIFPTNEWVNYFCSTNTYLGHPLPVGSVVDAFDPDGIHCGTFYVHTPGHYGFMPVYADDPYNPGDQGAEPYDLIRFYVNGIEAVTTGNTMWTEHGDTNEVCLEAGLEVTQICHLSEGWNLVSWRVDHASDYILDALASIEPCIEIVMGFEQGGLTYMPGLEQFSTLWYVDHLSGYWIKLKCDATLEITGVPVPISTPIPVTTGWNLVSYLPDFTLPTNEALGSVHNDLIVALGYDGGGLTYIPGDTLHNTLTYLAPCFGYWLKVTADGDLVYPAEGPIVVASSQKDNAPRLNASVPGVTATNRWVNLFSHNLMLDGETVPAGVVVTAHTLDGSQIGGFTMNQDGLFGFMAVYADDPGTPEVKGVQPGERFYLSINGVETNETFVWTEPGDHIEISAGLTAKEGSSGDETLPHGYSLDQNYPNPFNPTTTISFSVPATMNARIEIYNILGNLVATPFEGVAQAGLNTVVWDGRNTAGQSVASAIYF